MKLRVESHSGPKANQRPIKFWLGDDVHFVESVDDQWYGSEAEYFRLRADDGNTYVLSYSENKEEWTLEAFRSDRNPSQFDPRLDLPSNDH